MKYVVVNTKSWLLYNFGVGAYLTPIASAATRFSTFEYAKEVVDSYGYGDFVAVISEDESSIIEIMSQ